MKKVILTLATIAMYVVANAQTESTIWTRNSNGEVSLQNANDNLNVDKRISTKQALIMSGLNANKAPLGLTMSETDNFTFGYVNGDVSKDANDYTIFHYGLGFYSGKTTLNTTTDLGKTYLSSYHGLDFFTGYNSDINGPAMTLGHNKKLGIGNNNPIYTLDINSNDALGLHLKRKTPNGGEGSISLTLENYAKDKWYTSVGSEGGFTINNDVYTNAFNIKKTGEVVIGAWNPKTGYKLSVDGKVACEELTVQLSENWGDFVFDKSYELKTLAETENYITANKHLPGIPAASEIENKGLSLGEMQRLQMIKIEELTLHLIELNKQNETLKNNNQILEKNNTKNQEELAEIKSLLNQLILK